MSRRKQTRPVKRVLIEENKDDAEDPRKSKSPKNSSPNPKSSRLHEPSTSKPQSLKTVIPQPLKARSNALTLLENSLKKFEPSRSTTTPNGHSGSSGSLGALFNCIGKINNTVSPSETGGVASILKCLQCGAGFSIMEALVRHMQETKHFNNIAKVYGNAALQIDHQKIFRPKIQTKLDVQLACVKCGEIPVNMDQHLQTVHDIKKKSDWLHNVQVISAADLHSPHISQLMTLINSVAKK